MRRIDDAALVREEYASVDRLKSRRSDRTGWLRGDEAWMRALALIAQRPPRSVLDAGCGEGWFARLISAPTVKCIDSSAAAVEAARRYGLDASLADIQALPFDDGEFDVVVSNWVLYHLPNVDLGLSEIRRVLSDEGRFVGIYNRARHMSELWETLAHEWPADAFNDENGANALSHHFAHIERHDTEAFTLWETRDSLQEYLDAFELLAGRPLVAPEGPYPFTATRRTCVFVASGLS